MVCLPVTSTSAVHEPPNEYYYMPSIKGCYF